MLTDNCSTVYVFRPKCMDSKVEKVKIKTEWFLRFLCDADFVHIVLWWSFPTADRE